MSRSELKSILIDGYIRMNYNDGVYSHDIVNLIVSFYEYPHQWAIKKFHYFESNRLLCRDSYDRVEYCKTWGRDQFYSDIFQEGCHKFRLTVYPIGINRKHKEYIMIALNLIKSRKYHPHIQLQFEMLITQTNMRFDQEIVLNLANAYQFYLPKINRAYVPTELKDGMELCYKVKILSIKHSSTNIYETRVKHIKMYGECKRKGWKCWQRQ